LRLYIKYHPHIRMNQTIIDSEVNLNGIAINSTPFIQLKFNELVSEYDDYIRIFTDGSKIGEAVGAAAIVASRLCKKRLPNNSSISSVQARGILLTL